MTKRRQLGWRLPNADSQLLTPLFQFAYQEEMLIKVHGKQEAKWAAFTVLSSCACALICYLTN